MTTKIQTEKKVYNCTVRGNQFTSGLSAKLTHYRRYNEFKKAQAEGYTHGQIGTSVLRIETAIKSAWDRGGRQYESHLRDQEAKRERDAEVEARFAPYREWVDEQRVNLKGKRGEVGLAFRRDSQHHGHKSKATIYGPLAVTAKNSLKGQQVLHVRSGLHLPGNLDGEDVLRYIWLLLNSGIDWDFEGLSDHTAGTGRKAADIASRLEQEQVPEGWTPEIKDLYTLRDCKFYLEIVAPGLDRVAATVKGDDAERVRETVARFEGFLEGGWYPGRIYKSFEEQLSCFLTDFDLREE